MERGMRDRRDGEGDRGKGQTINQGRDRSSFPLVCLYVARLLLSPCPDGCVAAALSPVRRTRLLDGSVCSDSRTTPRTVFNLLFYLLLNLTVFLSFFTSIVCLMDGQKTYSIFFIHFLKPQVSSTPKDIQNSFIRLFVTDFSKPNCLFVFLIANVNLLYAKRCSEHFKFVQSIFPLQKPNCLLKYLHLHYYQLPKIKASQYLKPRIRKKTLHPSIVFILAAANPRQSNQAQIARVRFTCISQSGARATEERSERKRAGDFGGASSFWPIILGVNYVHKSLVRVCGRSLLWFTAPASPTDTQVGGWVGVGGEGGKKGRG